ncbi:MAG: response regulator [Bacilli bacterium]
MGVINEISVAVLDENKNDANTIKNLLCQFQIEKGITFKIRVFNKCIDFLKARTIFDFVFLETEFQDHNGLQIIKKICKKKINQTLFCFETKSSEYAIASYSQNVSRYLLKPITANSLFEALEGMIKQYQRNLSNYLFYLTDAQYDCVVLFKRRWKKDCAFYERKN